MEKEILQVQMLGGFSLVYQGKILVFERNYTSKSMQLLQILFLHLGNGIPKEQLLDELYSRDDVENRNGSLNNTIFRLRRQLEAAGLPEGKYFSLKDGIYRWDPVISVETDLSLFEKKLEESREETDEEKKVELMHWKSSDTIKLFQKAQKNHENSIDERDNERVYLLYLMKMEVIFPENREPGG